MVETLLGWGANVVEFVVSALIVGAIGIGILIGIALLLLVTGSGDPNADTRYPDALKYRDVNRKR